jgi:hypothetical protein
LDAVLLCGLDAEDSDAVIGGSSTNLLEDGVVGGAAWDHDP